MIFNYFRVPGAHFGDPGDFVHVIHYVILFAIYFHFFNAGHHLFALFCFVFYHRCHYLESSESEPLMMQMRLALLK